MAIGTTAGGGGGATLPLTGTGATVTTSAPLLDLSQTWNAAGVTFTGMKLNVTSTASAAASLLLDLEVGSVTQFSVNKAGGVVASQFFPSSGTAGAPAYCVNGSTTTGIFGASGQVQITASSVSRAMFDSTGLQLAAAGRLQWSSGLIAAASDTGLSRVGAGIIGAGNGAAADVSAELRLTKLTASGTIATGAPAGASAGLWKLGSLVTAVVVVDTSRSIFVDIGGTVYKLIVAV